MSDDFDFDFESGSPARDGAASHLPVPTAQVGLSDIWRPEGGTALMTVRDLGRVLQSDGVIDAAQLATARASQEKDPTRRLCLLYTSPSPRDATLSRMPSSA